MRRAFEEVWSGKEKRSGCIHATDLLFAHWISYQVAIRL